MACSRLSVNWTPHGTVLSVHRLDRLVPSKGYGGYAHRDARYLSMPADRSCAAGWIPGANPWMQGTYPGNGGNRADERFKG